MESFDKYWDDIHKRYNSTYDHWLDKYIPLFKEDSFILELGCGRAYCSKHLLENGFNNILATDFSEEALRIVKMESPTLKTELLDFSSVLPYKDNSIDVVVADLCLHYFDFQTTEAIFKEIHRVLTPNGYLVARVNSSNDTYHMPVNCEEIEENFFFDSKIYKKFFSKAELEKLANGFGINLLEEKNMDRYEKPKKLWEFCLKRK